MKKSCENCKHVVYNADHPLYCNSLYNTNKKVAAYCLTYAKCNIRDNYCSTTLSYDCLGYKMWEYGEVLIPTLPPTLFEKLRKKLKFKVKWI